MMMNYLFVDTSDRLKLGLLNKELQWDDYRDYDSKKNASILHNEVYELLKSHSLSLRETTGLFYCAGPGSYTGLKLVEGLSVPFECIQKPRYGFYHFELPSMVGVQKGLWISNAYKNEIFSYEWDTQHAKREFTLVKRPIFESKLEKAYQQGIPVYAHEELDYDNLQSSHRLLRDNAGKIFKAVLKRGEEKKVYYYREKYDEFRVSAP